MRKLFTAGTATLLLLAAGAPAASAKPKTDYSYIATIDCGSGPMTVGSTDDLFAPLVDLSTGRRYRPLAWDVAVGSESIQVTSGKHIPKHAVDCSYDDGVATGTVTVRKA